MLEINPLDSSITPIYQIDTQRSSVNPFAPADEAAAETTQQTEDKAKTNNIASATEFVNTFSLSEPSNKLRVLSMLNYTQQKDIVDLLDPEAKVLGMKLYDKEKILNLLFETSQQDISKVLMGAMPMEKIFEMIPEDFLNRFIMSDQLDKTNFMQAFEKFNPDQLRKFIENLTGLPQQNKAVPDMLRALSKIPFELLQPSLLTIKPEQKALMISKMMESNNELFQLFPKAQLLIPLAKSDKEEMLAGFGNLDTQLVGNMLLQLPQEMLPLVLTMINSEALSGTLLNKYPDVITAAFSNMSQF